MFVEAEDFDVLRATAPCLLFGLILKVYGKDKSLE